MVAKTCDGEMTFSTTEVVHPLLTVHKQATPLTGIVFNECFDMDALRRLLSSDYLRVIDPEWIREAKIKDYTNEFEQLIGVMGAKMVKYVRGKHQFGRVYPCGSLSLGSIRRKLRATICAKTHVDIDIVNCHANILDQIFNSNGVKYPALHRYVSNRDACRDEVITAFGLKDVEGCDDSARDRAKNLFIRGIYLGSIESWYDSNRAIQKDIGDNTPPRIVEGFFNEMQTIAEIIEKKNPLLGEIYDDKTGEKGNRNSSIMSYWCQEVERRCLEAMLNTLPRKIWAKCVLCFDGIMIPLGYYTKNRQTMQDKMQREIYKNVGLKMKLSLKEFTDVYDVSIYERYKPKLSNLLEIQSEAHWGTYFNTVYIDDFDRLRYDGLNFYECNANNIWEKHQTLRESNKWFEVIIHDFDLLKKDLEKENKQKANTNEEILKKCQAKGNVGWTDNETETYNKNKEQIKINKKRISTIIKCITVSGSVRFRKGVVQFLCDNYLLDENFTTKLNVSRDVLAFNDMIMDLSTMKAREIKPDDYISATCGYDFPEDLIHNPNHESFKIVNDFLTSIFKNEEERTYAIQCLASSLDGNNINEKLHIFKGRGRNGKGLLFTLLTMCMGDYISSVPIEFFTVKNNNPRSANPEIHGLKHVRILYSTEPENEACFQRSKAKQLTGNDEITTRTLYRAEIDRWTPQFSLYLQTNEDIKFAGGIDVAIQKRLNIIEFPYTFTDIIKDEEHEKQADPLLKTLFKQNTDLRDAFMCILLHEYKKIRGRVLVVPVSIREVIKETVVENNTVQRWIEEDVEQEGLIKITGNKKDYCKAKDLYDLYKTHNPNDKISNQTFYQKMEVCGFFRSTKDGVKVFRGITIIDVELP